MHGYGVCSLRARAESGDSAQLCFRGTLAVGARVYGAGGRGRSRDGRTGKTVCGVFLADVKRDLGGSPDPPALRLAIEIAHTGGVGSV